MTGTSYGRLLMALNRIDDKVLLAVALEAGREQQEWITAVRLRRLFEALRVPEPGGLSQALSRLASAGLVRKPIVGNGWDLTPAGRDYLRDLVGKLDPSSLTTELLLTGSAELSSARHPVIPALLAPLEFSEGVRALLAEFPFDSNVFLMTRFPKDRPETELPDPVQEVIACARATASKRNLHVHLASDRNARDTLFGNIAAHMWSCRFGIGLFETRFHDHFNDNLQIEVGGMLMTGRRCALLKDKDTPEMPTDFVGEIYMDVDFTDLHAVEATLDRAFDGFLLGQSRS